MLNFMIYLMFSYLISLCISITSIFVHMIVINTGIIFNIIVMYPISENNSNK